MTFSFSGLNLASVKAASSSVLPPGQYVCTTKDAEIANTKSGDGKILKVKLIDVQGKGLIITTINIFNKSEKAMEIGLEELKALLVHGGHPDPDNIGQHGVASVNGLTVGITVGSEMYEGTSRSKVKFFIDPKTVKGYEQDAAGGDEPAIGSAGGMPF